MSFYRKDFERILVVIANFEVGHIANFEVGHIYAVTAEYPLVITPVIANFEVGHMLVDTGSSVDILFLDAYLKLGMSRAQILLVATPLVGFTVGCGESVGGG
ncbi:hypothetical protein LIER_14994 [Lithospermum erythrorhizon]|uniref:Uncharacterized protein n=1 Tax=Lithospermum erythrorhizon TaxID=34254 RepID=A0AAV3Q245_LITER